MLGGRRLGLQLSRTGSADLPRTSLWSKAIRIAIALLLLILVGGMFLMFSLASARPSSAHACLAGMSDVSNLHCWCRAVYQKQRSWAAKSSRLHQVSAIVWPFPGFRLVQGIVRLHWPYTPVMSRGWTVLTGLMPTRVRHEQCLRPLGRSGPQHSSPGLRRGSSSPGISGWSTGRSAPTHALGTPRTVSAMTAGTAAGRCMRAQHLHVAPNNCTCSQHDH